MPHHEHSINVEAVVLRHSNWDEADRLLVMYTRQQGKLRAIAKGARRLRSRKAGHLEPFTCVKLMLARGRDLWIVTQAETVEAYLPLREDIIRTGHAAYVLELIDRFTYEEGENHQLYQLLVDTLHHLTDEEDVFSALRYFEIHLLDLLGFRPQLFNCVKCGQEIKPEAQYFSALLGGVLCQRCGPVTASARPVSMLALKYLRHFQRSTYADAQRAHPEPGVRHEMEALLQYYLTYLLERGLNTPDFLRQVGRSD
ncbi:MAG: DNA repair protein RecO [Anaerolineaceae bacterium]|nr:DNA repair protein RecO [Anaerolineaceae bacterium]